MKQESVAKPKKVAVIYHYFAHYREAVIQELIHNSRHHYEFLADNQSFGTGIKLAENIPDDRFRRTKCRFIGPFLFQLAAIKAALGFKYDTLILLGNCKWPTTWLAAILGRIRGKRILFWGHCWLRKETGLKAKFLNTFFKIPHALLMYGHRAKNIGIDFGFSPDKLHVIYNSLDCKLQDKTIAAINHTDRNLIRKNLFGSNADNPILVNITRLHHYKKLEQLLEAAQFLNNQNFPVNVLIIGDGPHKTDLEKLAIDKKVSAVFTGALYDEHEIGTMLSASDIAVMPGPVGLLAMHALAYGVPVISNNNFNKQMPEFESIVPGLTGEFFEPDSIPSIAEAIKKTINNSPSIEQRRINTRQIIERFYNPVSQRILIDRAVEGHDANDLFNANIRSYKEN